MLYTKMHGAGNSFVLTENLHGELDGADLPALARRLCSAQSGPGADGLIVLVPSAEADFGMRFLNEDGSYGEMCGNGVRCAARYGVEHGLVRSPSALRIRAEAGLIRGRRISRDRYEVSLPDPSLIDLHRMAEGRDCSYVELGRPGLPHAVTEVPLSALEDPTSLRALGRALRRSPAFPRGANVSFVCRTGDRSLRALTFERGVEDFTLSCGTGCGACALSMLLRGRIQGAPVEIEMPGGLLSVSLEREGETVRALRLTGPTAIVTEGELPALAIPA